ncbi:RNase adapter RapZ [Vibrio sp. SS-MA-C1-2]|uniref:RNase adapter RapZ n=1 Tax=Vibrio sp. SS-MA-C1-2 TaxID=2908646 RepID=UPI001F1BB304|nr:RNase adapter RapZ [Vibrio sp. SS-MA-C1-2]UJF19580.1 RNase adapter RapZ [Vibrio sp. SS-MA-C1-2]
MALMILSGRSGAGKSVALGVLEDLNYYCVDNLPISMLPQLIETLDDEKSIAVSIDARNVPEDQNILTEILEQRPNKDDSTIIFLDSTDDVLIKRYSETRRLHPLTRLNMTLEQAIHFESSLLSPIKAQADLVIDTSKKSIHDLSETIRARVLGKKERELVMVFESFGFKHGLPSDADFVFDVRFLPNPHWQVELKPLTGLDQPVIDFLSHQDEVNKLTDQLRYFIQNWLPSLERNNRSYLTIAIGCTGGQHRSVYVAQQLADFFRHSGQSVQVRHKTLEISS